MNSQVFYRKWRPQTFTDVAGQKHVTHTLLNALRTGHVSHAYLFCGPRGTGKTSTGRILAKALNCLTSGGKGEPCNTCNICLSIMEDRALDVIEIDAASNRSIDDVRELREKVNYAPQEARRKVYIIDEFHMLSKDACNALLKTLEEPPPHVVFVLATTEVHKVLPTIMSRCQRFDFHRLSQADVVTRLAEISKAEGITIETQSLQLIARGATGSLRDAENLLEQIAAYYGMEIQINQVQAMLGITGDRRSKELVKHIVNNDIPAGISTINNINKDGLDLRQFNREFVENLRQLLLVKTGAGQTDTTAENLVEFKAIAEKASLQQIIKAIKLFSQLEFGLDNYSTLPLEMALVESCLPSEGEKPVIKPIFDVVEKTAAPTASFVKTDITETAFVKEPAVKAEKNISRPEFKAKEEADLLAKTQPISDMMAMDKAPTLSNEIERLKAAWKQAVDNHQKGINKTTIAFLKSAVSPQSIEGNIVVLSVKYPMHKDIVEKGDNKQVAEKVISGFLGRTCIVRCVCQPENNHLVKAALKMGAQVTSVEEK